MEPNWFRKYFFYNKNFNGEIKKSNCIDKITPTAYFEFNSQEVAEGESIYESSNHQLNIFTNVTKEFVNIKVNLAIYPIKIYEV